ncbi:ribonuclease H-like domain-containing protein [Coniella lustricola]|uniref:ribonuclease H n=1 Tax=Coniella lustricola TaxID=2025994 RepID=A0A2T3AF87_9PEZI|nr:ribonuclease H-like domain-containing protein [Coniella lustricola]
MAPARTVGAVCCGCGPHRQPNPVPESNVSAGRPAVAFGKAFLYLAMARVSRSGPQVEVSFHVSLSDWTTMPNGSQESRKRAATANTHMPGVALSIRSSSVTGQGLSVVKSSAFWSSPELSSIFSPKMPLTRFYRVLPSIPRVAGVDASAQPDRHASFLRARTGAANMAPALNIDAPIELHNGRTLVCRRHRLVVCGRCCVDYSFMQDNSDADDSEADVPYLRRTQQPQDEDEDANNDDKLPDLASLRIGNVVDLSKPTRAASGPQPGMPRPLVAGAFFTRRGPRKDTPRGTGLVHTTEFVSAFRPQLLFAGLLAEHYTRYIDYADRTRFLIFTDGACLNNGQENPRAGWAFVTGPCRKTDPPHLGDAQETVSGRLENSGSYGDAGKQTSNRAELRAVIAVLKYRYWPNDSLETMVIATDSTYVVDGATRWVRGWLRNGWKTRAGQEVKNKDLWECLLGLLEDLHRVGTLHKPCKVQFWKIPREWNTTADAAAKKSALQAEVQNHSNPTENIGDTHVR